MPVTDYVSKIGRGIAHLASGALALDVVNNVTQGNYETAAAEAIIAAYIEASIFLGKREEQYLSKLKQLAIEVEELAKELRARTGRQFDNLFRHMGDVPTIGPPRYSLEEVISPSIEYWVRGNKYSLKL